jgi:hypothetical protein
MITWEEHKVFIVIALIILLVILVDEWAYNGWKKANPGSLYSHLFNKGPFSIVNPLDPPTVPYDERNLK